MEPTPARLLRERARLNPDATAYVSDERRIDFRTAEREASALAAHLDANGVGAGDRVVVLAKNSDFLATSLFAVSWLGAIAVIANWRLPAAELAHVFDDSEPVAVLADEAFGPAVQELRQARPGIRHVVVDTADDYRAIIADARAHGAEPAGSSADAAVIMYTSGTTGRSKGAVLTGANLYWSAEGMVSTIPWEPGHRFLLVAPMFHIGGLAPLLANVLRGTATVFLRDFDPAAVWRTIAEERITTMMTVPLMLRALTHVAGLGPVDASSLVNVTCGGAPVADELAGAFTAAVGVPVQLVYGVTEFTGAVAFRLGGEGAAHAGSTGRAVFGGELAVADPATGQALAPGETGEVLIRGPQRFAGYWRDEASTAAAITADGWYRSGDVGRIDEDGFVRLVDRVKDVVISGGENIYPAELEVVLAAHPAVADVAVVGRPDETWGEVPIAFVVAAPGTAAEGLEAELVEACRAKLAGYKTPKAIRFVEAIPRNTLGKVLKRQLRDEERAAA
ncbi:class I adenylate-forming enzyme family protein [Agromyces archimandritae]|uniref:AMP-binding protein n=1 Tax=Agromyces archimandritae TaxID=2781962 RepID=A0A975FKF6_9MICO|nr:AMP-binding protein [Agromyces archimandritae]QTX04173.1 AMP-binding protein [Agromyces archimandritae]